MPAPHIWKVFRVSGLDQIRLSTAEDLRQLGTLDRKLWVALSCPISGLEFDDRTLALMDRDKDGRVRVEEVIHAVAWACARLRDPAILFSAPSVLPFTAFADNPEGQALIAAAKQVLVNLGKPDHGMIGIEDTADPSRIFAKSAFNGDGVVTAFQTHDAAIQELLTEILATCSPALDRSGEPGVDQQTLASFIEDLAAYETWWEAGERAAAAGTDTLPLGEATPNAYSALAVVRSKIADWFARARLAAFDPRAAEPLNRDAAAYAAIASRDLGDLGEDIATLPLRRVEPGVDLELGQGINPAWAARIANFRTLVVVPLLGADRTILREADFQAIEHRFADFAQWTSDKKGAAVEKLGISRIRTLRMGDVTSKLAALIAQDQAVAGDLSALDDLGRLLLYGRDLITLLRNYLNFADFYAPDRAAIFQAGTLYLDQRSCDLCVRVADVGAHSTLAIHSKLCLIYCECLRPDAGKMVIAAAMTQGNADYLMVGRRGVFYDRNGRDWDTTVVKMVDNPISLLQAFWSPYKKFVRLIEDSIEKFAAAKEKAVQDVAAIKVQALPASTPPADAKKTAFDIARFAGIFAAIGLALGAIGAALGALIGAVAKLVWWQQLLVIPGIMLVISLPSVVIAGIKLRQRTLGPLLEGSQWAINGRVKISYRLGRVLTAQRRLPPGARRLGKDPYARNATRWWLAFFLLLALGGGLGGYWWMHRQIAVVPAVIMPEATPTPKATPTPEATPTPDSPPSAVSPVPTQGTKSVPF